MRWIIAVSLTLLTGCASLSTPSFHGSSSGLSLPEFYPGVGQGTTRESNVRPGEFSLNWPLNQVRINQPFRPNKKRRPHLGVDFAGVKGTPIFSAHEGVVVYAGRAFKGFGKMVIVEYDDQWATLYAHLDKILVRSGQKVEQGQTVGRMGRTGRATGVHLHFELLHHKRPVDPIPLINEFHNLVNIPGPNRKTATN